MSTLTHSLVTYIGVSVDQGGSPKLLNSIQPDAFSQRLNDPRYLNFVAVQAKQICGFVSLRDTDYLYHLFVSSRFHRQGVGLALWLRALTSSTSDTITLRSSIYAIPVYERWGFKLDGAAGQFENYHFQPMIWRRPTG